LIRILGIEVPDAGRLFFAALAVHVLAGLGAVLCGAIAATAAKRAGRHPRFGKAYLWLIGVVFASSTVLAAIRWRHSWHLFVIGVVAFGSALVGWRAKRRGQLHRHILGMGLSYVAMLTAFYVDNGHQLPLWDRLPPIAYWLLPAAVGGPLIARAIHRYAATPEPFG